MRRAPSVGPVSTSKKRKREVSVARSFIRESTPAPLPVVTFNSPGGRSFARVLKEQTLDEFKQSIRAKLRLDDDVDLRLAQARDGRHVDLEDDEDFEAFAATGEVDPQLEVDVEWDSDQGFTIKTPAKAAPTKKKRKTVHATKPTREPTPEPSDEEQQSFGARAAKAKYLAGQERGRKLERVEPEAKAKAIRSKSNAVAVEESPERSVSPTPRAKSKSRAPEQSRGRARERTPVQDSDEEVVHQKKAKSRSKSKTRDLSPPRSRLEVLIRTPSTKRFVSQSRPLQSPLGRSHVVVAPSPQSSPSPSPSPTRVPSPSPEHVTPQVAKKKKKKQQQHISPTHTEDDPAADDSADPPPRKKKKKKVVAAPADVEEDDLDATESAPPKKKKQKKDVVAPPSPTAADEEPKEGDEEEPRPSEPAKKKKKRKATIPLPDATPVVDDEDASAVAANKSGPEATPVKKKKKRTVSFSRPAAEDTEAPVEPTPIEAENEPSTKPKKKRKRAAAPTDDENGDDASAPAPTPTAANNTADDEQPQEPPVKKSRKSRRKQTAAVDDDESAEQEPEPGNEEREQGHGQVLLDPRAQSESQVPEQDSRFESEDPVDLSRPTPPRKSTKKSKEAIRRALANSGAKPGGEDGHVGDTSDELPNPPPLDLDAEGVHKERKNKAIKGKAPARSLDPALASAPPPAATLAPAAPSAARPASTSDFLAGFLKNYANKTSSAAQSQPPPQDSDSDEIDGFQARPRLPPTPLPTGRVPESPDTQRRPLSKSQIVLSPAIATLPSSSPTKPTTNEKPAAPAPARSRSTSTSYSTSSEHTAKPSEPPALSLDNIDDLESLLRPSQNQLLKTRASLLSIEAEKKAQATGNSEEETDKSESEAEAEPERSTTPSDVARRRKRMSRLGLVSSQSQRSNGYASASDDDDDEAEPGDGVVAQPSLLADSQPASTEQTGQVEEIDEARQSSSPERTPTPVGQRGGVGEPNGVSQGGPAVVTTVAHEDSSDEDESERGASEGDKVNPSQLKSSAVQPPGNVDRASERGSDDGESSSAQTTLADSAPPAFRPHPTPAVTKPAEEPISPHISVLRTSSPVAGRATDLESIDGYQSQREDNDPKAVDEPHTPRQGSPIEPSSPWTPTHDGSPKQKPAFTFKHQPTRELPPPEPKKAASKNVESPPTSPRSPLKSRQMRTRSGASSSKPLPQASSSRHPVSPVVLINAPPSHRARVSNITPQQPTNGTSRSAEQQQREGSYRSQSPPEMNVLNPSPTMYGKLLSGFKPHVPVGRYSAMLPVPLRTGGEIAPTTIPGSQPPLAPRSLGKLTEEQMHWIELYLPRASFTKVGLRTFFMHKSVQLGKSGDSKGLLYSKATELMKIEPSFYYKLRKRLDDRIQSDRAQLALLPPPPIPPSPDKVAHREAMSARQSIIWPSGAPFATTSSPALPSTKTPVVDRPAPLTPEQPLPHNSSTPVPSTSVAQPLSKERVVDSVVTSPEPPVKPRLGRVNSASSSADASVVDHLSSEPPKVVQALPSPPPQQRTPPLSRPSSPLDLLAAVAGSAPRVDSPTQPKQKTPSSSAPVTRGRASTQATPALPASQRFRTYPRNSATPSVMSLRNMTQEQVRSAVKSKASTPAAATGSALRTQTRKKPARRAASEDEDEDEDDEDDSDDSDAQPTPQSRIPVHRRAGASLGGSKLDRARRLTGTQK